MHPANTEKQNAELTDLFLKIDAFYYKAIRRPSKQRSKLVAGLGEIYWKAQNHRYRDVIDVVRFAARNFRHAAKAVSIDEAMQVFSVRPEDVPTWRAISVASANGVATGLPPGAVVLAPALRRAGNSKAHLFAVAA